MTELPSDEEICRAIIRSAQNAEVRSQMIGGSSTRTILSSAMWYIWHRWMLNDPYTKQVEKNTQPVNRIWGSEVQVVISDNLFAYSYPIPREGVGIS